MTPIARLHGVERHFGSVRALHGAQLEIHAGEVHGLLGENGAGKSTLLGVLSGLQTPDAGGVELHGAPVRLTSPRDAWDRGIGLVHQHFALVPSMSVLDNLALGRRGGGSGLRLDRGRVGREASALMDRLGLGVDLDATVETLGVGARQRVEILKALLRDPPILALDEPTAVLTPGEVDALFALLRGLAEEGRAVVVVAHKVREILQVADRVTVLRAGRTVLSGMTSGLSEAELVRAMVGGAVTDGFGAEGRRRASGEAGEVVATLVDAGIGGRGGGLAVSGASLEIRRGEIVGVAGVEGNGQRELASLVAGRLRPDHGEATRPAGVGFVPQDRTTEGLIADFDLAENVALALHDDAASGRGPFMSWARVRERAESIRSKYGILVPGLRTPAGALSGGNQQRLVVGRELSIATDLLVAENPTRGLDVAAAAFVHGELRRLIDLDVPPGVLLVSTDLDEVLELSDRVLVMVSGRLRPVPGDARSREGVGALMLGGGGVAA